MTDDAAIQAYQQQITELRQQLRDCDMEPAQHTGLQSLVDVMDGALGDIIAGRKTIAEVRIAFRLHGLDHDEVMRHLFKWLHHDIPRCGCYAPDEADQLMIDVCDLVALDAPWETICERIGGGDATVQIVMQVIESAGLISHGSSLRASWITDRGEWVRRVFRDIAGDEIDDYGLPHDRPDWKCPPECPLGQLSVEGVRRSGFGG